MPPIKPFLLERYFAQYEFKAPFLLSPSDCESLALRDLIKMADPDSLARWENLSLGYTDSAGHPVLREEITRLYGSISPNEILVLTPEEGIYIAMHALLSPGEDIITVTPAYQSLLDVAASIGCRVIEWPLLKINGHWELNISTLSTLVTPKTRMVVINFPNNPTGYIADVEAIIQIVASARKSGFWIFSDEMYRSLEYDPAIRLPPITDLYEKGISLSGMSKVYGLPGLRIGWLATRDRTALDRFTVYKDYTTICNNAPGEILALMALRAKGQILDRNLAIISENLGYVQSMIARHPRLFCWYQPDGGSVAFPEWVGPGDLDQLCQDLINASGVMVVSGIYFGFPGSHFRIGLGRLNLKQVLGEVEKFIADKYGG